jgi:hypothetical protein
VDPTRIRENGGEKMWFWLMVWYEEVAGTK